MKVCPFCAEDIKSEAIKCKHCGSMLEAIGSVSIEDKSPKATEPMEGAEQVPVVVPGLAPIAVNIGKADCLAAGSIEGAFQPNPQTEPIPVPPSAARPVGNQDKKSAAEPAPKPTWVKVLGVVLGVLLAIPMAIGLHVLLRGLATAAFLLSLFAIGALISKEFAWALIFGAGAFGCGKGYLWITRKIQAGDDDGAQPMSPGFKKFLIVVAVGLPICGGLYWLAMNLD